MQIEQIVANQANFATATILLKLAGGLQAMLIRMERHAGDSDRMITQLVGVAHSLVQDRRKLLEKQEATAVGPQLRPEKPGVCPRLF